MINKRLQQRAVDGWVVTMAGLHLA